MTTKQLSPKWARHLDLMAAKSRKAAASKAGKASRASLTPEARKAQALKAITARWANHTKKETK